MARYNDTEKERDITVFGPQTKFNGTLSFTEELHIAGTFKGSIDARGELVIKKGANCETDHVRAASIIVEGSIQGDLTAADRLEMKSGSKVRGNISASRLKIADGVSFEGSVEMLRQTVDVDVFSARPDILKESLSTAQH